VVRSTVKETLNALLDAIIVILAAASIKKAACSNAAQR